MFHIFMAQLDNDKSFKLKETIVSSCNEAPWLAKLFIGAKERLCAVCHNLD